MPSQLFDASYRAKYLFPNSYEMFHIIMILYMVDLIYEISYILNFVVVANVMQYSIMLLEARLLFTNNLQQCQL